jgi:hypothetical protein
MTMHGEIDLEGDGLVGIRFDGRFSRAAEPRNLFQRAAIRGPEEALELELVLDEGRLLQFGFEGRTEGWIGEGEREAARQAVHGSPLDGAPGIR